MFNRSKPIPAIAALLVLGLGACSSATAKEPAIGLEVNPSAEELIAPWISDVAPGIAVAVSLNDQLVLSRGAGMANLEHEIPITPESVFQVASVSKQVTAFATLILVTDGAIDLDEDIRTYVPEMPHTPTKITVRHLLDHTSGLRERNTLSAMAGWLPDDVHTEVQSRSLVRRQRGVNFSAGEEIEYSNTGYALLAEIVERASGQTFHAFTKTRIFDPLGMSKTQFPDDRNTLIPGRASSYYPDQDGFKNVLVTSETFGSTGLYTNVLDLLKWAENFETQTVGEPAVFEMMAERFQATNGDASPFAKGQELRLHKGYETWSHGGTDAGYRSFLLRVPSKDLEIAVIGNRTDFDKAAFAFAMADAFLDEQEPPSQTDSQTVTPATTEQLQAFSGDYEIFPGVIFSIRATSDGLTFAPYGAPREGLEPLPQIGPREFELNEKPQRTLIFETPTNGVSDRLSYRVGLDGEIKAPRIALAAFDPSSVDLTHYVGRCESEELATRYDLEIIEGTLMATHSRQPAFALSAYQPDTFSGQGPLQKLAFERDTQGRVIGFYASAPLAEGIWFSCE